MYENGTVCSGAKMDATIVKVEGWDVAWFGSEEEDTEFGDGDNGSSEPRIRDTDLAERLGFSRPRDIRRLIKKHRKLLERFGPLNMRAESARISKPNGGIEERKVKSGWLNEPQAISVVLKSDAPRADDVSAMVVSVFVAVRRGDFESANQMAHQPMWVAAMKEMELRTHTLMREMHQGMCKVVETVTLQIKDNVTHVVERVSELEGTVAGFGGRITEFGEEIDKRLTSVEKKVEARSIQKKPVNQTDERHYLWDLRQFRSIDPHLARCPLCRKNELLDRNGNRLPDTEFHHIEKAGTPVYGHVLLCCFPCHRQIEGNTEKTQQAKEAHARHLVLLKEHRIAPPPPKVSKSSINGPREPKISSPKPPKRGSGQGELFWA